MHYIPHQIKNHRCVSFWKLTCTETAAVSPEELYNEKGTINTICIKLNAVSRVKMNFMHIGGRTVPNGGQHWRFC